MQGRLEYIEPYSFFAVIPQKWSNRCSRLFLSICKTLEAWLWLERKSIFSLLNIKKEGFQENKERSKLGGRIRITVLLALIYKYLSCVKKIAHVDVEIPLEPHYITIRTMHYLFDQERMKTRNWVHIDRHYFGVLQNLSLCWIFERFLQIETNVYA